MVLVLTLVLTLVTVVDVEDVAVVAVVVVLVVVGSVVVVVGSVVVAVVVTVVIGAVIDVAVLVIGVNVGWLSDGMPAVSHLTRPKTISAMTTAPAAPKETNATGLRYQGVAGVWPGP